MHHVSKEHLSSVFSAKFNLMPKTNKPIYILPGLGWYMLKTFVEQSVVK